WTTVVLHHSYVTGGNSDHEHFGPPDALNDRLSTETTESCNTYNMLKLTRRLFTWDASPACAEFYERALYNHILGSQDPETGRVTYYVPLESGRMKTYQTLFDTFSCCVGTGMENHTRYGEAIYFHDAAGLYVNLFIPSELTWREKGFVLRQETRFPDEDATELRIRCGDPVELTLHLRYPAWARDGVELRVNGEAVAGTAAPGSYIPLRRTWRDGDTIAARYPMRVHTEAMPDNPRRVALLYGPIVLAGALGETERAPNRMPVLITDDQPVAAWLKPVAGEPLTFVTDGVGHPEDLRLIPFFRMHHQRHVVYWDLFTPEQWEARQTAYREEQARRQALDARTLDYVQPGEMQPERDHAFEGENSRHGMHLDRAWRDAADGGWFAFTMKVSPDRPVELICTYWGSDAGGRVFDILVDGERIATQSLETPQDPGTFFDVAYPIPPEHTRGKDRVRVTFQARPGMMAGGVFGCRTALPR
ncbi:MAG TPA: glycoside hydrolase family 127 protein, partial [Candidatus Hydrogenedentes bacterium]|nr:glycoside hydrolase family 127 protein [Candidatus Hydrogenedentota bacterium]